MSNFDSQVIKLVCDADFTKTHGWANKFRDRTIEEMIFRYQQGNED